MTDLGRSFLMREMRLRRIPGVSKFQIWFRRRRPASGIPGENVVDPPEEYWHPRTREFRELEVLLAEEKAKANIQRREI
jgi:hypothetical protein